MSGVVAWYSRFFSEKMRRLTKIKAVQKVKLASV
jgi:hypothetical protein